jgi:hypothetical protein
MNGCAPAANEDSLPAAYSAVGRVGVARVREEADKPQLRASVRATPKAALVILELTPVDGACMLVFMSQFEEYVCEKGRPAETWGVDSGCCPFCGGLLDGGNHEKLEPHVGCGGRTVAYYCNDHSGHVLRSHSHPPLSAVPLECRSCPDLDCWFVADREKRIGREAPYGSPVIALRYPPVEL